MEDDDFKDLLSGLNFDFGGAENGPVEEEFDLFRADADEYDFETRYLKPKKRLVNAQEYVCYDNAKLLAEKIKIGEGSRYDCIIGGNFIFGDLIEAFVLRNNCKCTDMVISTLSLSQDNIDSLANLINHGYIDRLSLIISVFFYAHERSGLIPYIYSKLDTDKCNFQMSVTDVHTKTVQISTLGGKKIVFHGSANLRSSGNIEQITIEENPELYDFYYETYRRIEEEYHLIRKPIRRAKAWNLITNK